MSNGEGTMSNEHGNDATMQWVKDGWRETWGRRIPATPEEWVDYHVRRSVLIGGEVRAEADLRFDAIMAVWSCAFLWEVVRRYVPNEIAAAAGKSIQLACEAGDGWGEWAYDWADDLRSGRQITLPGLDDSGDL